MKFCADLGSVERTFATLQAAASQVIVIPCRTDASTQCVSKDNITKAVNAGKKRGLRILELSQSLANLGH